MTETYKAFLEFIYSRHKEAIEDHYKRQVKSDDYEAIENYAISFVTRTKNESEAIQK